MSHIIEEAESLSFIFDGEGYTWRESGGQVYVEVGKLVLTGKDVRQPHTIRLIITINTEALQNQESHGNIRFDEIITLQIITGINSQSYNEALAEQAIDHLYFVYATSYSIIESIITYVREHYVVELCEREKQDARVEDTVTPIVQRERKLNSIKEHTSSMSFELGIEIFHGPVTIEKRSAFQAHFARVHNHMEIDDVLLTLSTNSRFESATHNVVAYVTSMNKLKISDCDSDGENGAGEGMAWLLSTLRVENVIVIVSRWYGGIQLGPLRFKIINSLTRDILEAHKCIPMK